MKHPRLAAQALELSRITRELSRCCQAKEEQLFKQAGLSCAEGHALLAIAELELTTASAVAERLALSKGRLTPLVDGLVRKKFLTRTESESDRRSHELALTEDGQAISRTVLDYQVTFHEALLKRFAADDRAQLLETLDLLRMAMEEQRMQGENSHRLTARP